MVHLAQLRTFQKAVQMDDHFWPDKSRMSRFVFLKKGRREKMAGRMPRQHAGDDNDYVLRIALIEQVCKRESEGEEREREKIHVVC